MNQVDNKVFIMGAALWISLSASCAGFTAKQIVKTVLDEVETQCVLLHDDLPDVDAAKACGIAEDLVPFIRHLFEAHRAAMARHPGVCSPTVK